VSNPRSVFSLTRVGSPHPHSSLTGVRHADIRDTSRTRAVALDTLGDTDGVPTDMNPLNPLKSILVRSQQFLHVRRIARCVHTSQRVSTERLSVATPRDE
jgi:hypothetical protein